MKVFLNVPYNEKDGAKQLGAKWDASVKKWYVPDGVDPEPFFRWLASSRWPKSYIFLVVGKRTCYKCNKETRVIAFGFKGNDSCGEQIMTLSPRPLCTPMEIREYLKSQGIRFDKKLSNTTGEFKLNNCCEHCGALQGEFFLFNEIDSPFFIAGEESLESLCFYRIKIPNLKPLKFLDWPDDQADTLLNYAESHAVDIDLELVDEVYPEYYLDAEDNDVLSAKIIAYPGYNKENGHYSLEMAELVSQVGIIGVEGTKSIAEPFIHEVLEILRGKESGEFIPEYDNVPNHGYLYFIVDNERFNSSDRKEGFLEIDRSGTQ